MRAKRTDMIKERKITSSPYTYLIDEESSFAMVEAYQNLMTNVSFAIPQKAEGYGKIVCVTSSLADEGKTTIACNLALTCANAGNKVVLIDCDLRKHNVSRAFRIHVKKGLADHLSGQAELAEVLVKSHVPNLDLLCSSKSAPNPIVLFNSPSFEALLQQLSLWYDYIIIDTPPVGVVSDGMTIAAKSDGVVLVVKRLLTHKILQETIANLEFANCTILGLVLKDFLLDRHSGYYYKYYYNNYYGDETNGHTK